MKTKQNRTVLLRFFFFGRVCIRYRSVTVLNSPTSQGAFGLRIEVEVRSDASSSLLLLLRRGGGGGGPANRNVVVVKLLWKERASRQLRPATVSQ